MRATRALCLAALSLILPSNLSPQQAVSIPRDAQAATVLPQMIAAAGWRRASLPTAVAASGTLTRPGDDQSESVTIKQSGQAQYRMDAAGPSGTTATVVNGPFGRLLFADGTKHRLSPAAALSIQPP